MKVPFISILALATCLSSCAYLQTHKNVREAFHQCEGYRLVEPLQLYSGGNSWYLAVQPETMRMHYPALHDSVFLDNNTDPTYSSIRVHQNPCFLRISSGTAKVLQRNDGYYTLKSLMEEMQTLDAEPVQALPAGASRHQVRAVVEAHEKDNSVIVASRTPESTPVVGQVLAAVDFVCVDFPGSVAYNVAIPVMAPIVFFRNFFFDE